MRCAALVMTLSLAAACGGGESAPKPLRYTLDDFQIAAIDVGAKGGVIQAKQDYDVAQMEKAKSQSDLDDAKTKVEVARNEAEAAALKQKSAATEKAAAAKTADMTKQGAAESSLRVAEAGKAAADAKVNWLKAKVHGLERLVRFGDYNMFAKESLWQLEKARVAMQNNIRPQGFDIMNFERQSRERADAALRARGDADQAMGQAAEKERAWQEADRRANEVRGTQGGNDPNYAQPYSQ